MRCPNSLSNPARFSADLAAWTQGAERQQLRSAECYRLAFAITSAGGSEQAKCPSGIVAGVASEPGGNKPRIRPHLLNVARVVSWSIERLSGESGLPLSALGSLLLRGSTSARLCRCKSGVFVPPSEFEITPTVAASKAARMKTLLGAAIYGHGHVNVCRLSENQACRQRADNTPNPDGHGWVPHGVVRAHRAEAVRARDRADRGHMDNRLRTERAPVTQQGSNHGATHLTLRQVME